LLMFRHNCQDILAPITMSNPKVNQKQPIRFQPDNILKILTQNLKNTLSVKHIDQVFTLVPAYLSRYSDSSFWAKSRRSPKATISM
jgi:hypothetical protein